MDADNIIIRCEGLKKSYGRIEALKGINLEIKKGTFLTIFGPNGAGKTTLLNILAGVMRFKDGKIYIMGKDIKTDAGSDVRKYIGVISHNTYLYDNLTPYENLTFYGKIYGVSNLDERIKTLLDKVGIKERMHDKLGTFSKGMQQRVAIARSIIHDPTILFLDEPHTGLDQHAAYMFKEMLSGIHDGNRSIIMTTHNITRGLEICDKVAIQVKGKIVYEESISNIDKNNFEKLYFSYAGRASTSTEAASPERERKG